jgi:ribosomal protein L11 methyltransferase
MRWAQLTVSSEVGAIDAVGNCLNDIGCNGFVIEDELVPVRLSGYLPVDDRLETRIEQLGDQLVALGGHGVSGAGVDITIRYVDEEDWANAWKAFFKPMRAGKRLIVTPPWELPSITPSSPDSQPQRGDLTRALGNALGPEAVLSARSDLTSAQDNALGPETPQSQPDDVIIIIDPGMAFGTGSHPTTRLCLAAIEEFLIPGTRVADIGTGSGILAIAAAKLGAAYVRACDIDPLAVRIARENTRANGVTVDVSEALPSGAFDLIVANILADVIIGMANDLASRLAPKGVLIASGIIDTRAADVVEALDEIGLTCVELRYEGEWIALVCVFDERR